MSLTSRLPGYRGYLLLLIFLTLLLIIFLAYPLFRTLTLSLDRGSGGLLGNYREILSRPYYIKATLHSLGLGASVASAATLLGFAYAHEADRHGGGLGRFLRGTALLPLVTPPFMLALALILLFGRNGLISSGLLNLDSGALYGFPGLFLVQTISLFPLSYVINRSVLGGIDSDLTEGALNLGAPPGRVFRTITLPLTRAGLVVSWLLIFSASLTDFGNPILIGGEYQVLSVQTYLEFVGGGNLSRGAALALLLMVPSTAGYFFQRRFSGKTRIAGLSGSLLSPVSTHRYGAGRGPALLLAMFSGGILLLYLTILAGSFVRLWGVDWSLTLDHLTYSHDVGLKTLRNTLYLALVSAPLSALLGLAAALVIRRFPKTGRFLEGLTLLGTAAPGAAVGIGYILAFSRAPFRLSGTAMILILLYVFRNMPLGLEGGLSALRQIPPSIEESSRNLGAGEWRTLGKITLPLISTAVYSSLGLSFARSMTALSAVIFLVSARWNHMTVLVFSQTEIMRLGAASVMSLVVTLIILGVLAVLSRLSAMRRITRYG